MRRVPAGCVISVAEVEGLISVLAKYRVLVLDSLNAHRPPVCPIDKAAAKYLREELREINARLLELRRVIR